MDESQVVDRDAPRCARLGHGRSLDDWGDTMKRTMIAAILAATLVLVMAPAAFASGKTAPDAAERGWTCFNAGPDNWTHCLQAEQIGTPRILVMVFSEDGTEYLGDEHLIRADKYDGRPCPADNLETWDGPLGPDLDGDGVGDYFGCHAYDTGRN